MPDIELKELPTAEELLSRMSSLSVLESLYIEYMNRITDKILDAADNHKRITYVSGVLSHEKVTPRLLESLKEKGYKINANVYSADKVKILEIKW